MWYLRYDLLETIETYRLQKNITIAKMCIFAIAEANFTNGI